MKPKGSQTCGGHGVQSYHPALPLRQTEKRHQCDHRSSTSRAVKRTLEISDHEFHTNMFPALLASLPRASSGQDQPVRIFPSPTTECMRSTAIKHAIAVLGRREVGCNTCRTHVRMQNVTDTSYPSCNHIPESVCRCRENTPYGGPKGTDPHDTHYEHMPRNCIRIFGFECCMRTSCAYVSTSSGGSLPQTFRMEARHVPNLIGTCLHERPCHQESFIHTEYAAY